MNCSKKMGELDGLKRQFWEGPKKNAQIYDGIPANWTVVQRDLTPIGDHLQQFRVAQKNPICLFNHFKVRGVQMQFDLKNYIVIINTIKR